MSEFVTWATLGTYGGALAMVLLLTQITKELPGIRNLPTQLWSYVLAFVVLILACAFTEGLTLDFVAQTLFNAAIVSVAANGSFAVVQNITHGDIDGELLIDKTGDKEIYRFEVGDLDELAERSSITLKVVSEAKIDIEPGD